MKIQNYTTNQINFRAITLNEKEQERSNRILSGLDKAENKDRIKTGLLDVFDKHIQKEAELKSKEVYFEEDVLQKLYFNFFEAIENIKDLTTQKLIEIIDATRPDKDELKEQYRLDTTSLNNYVGNDVDKKIEDFITADNLPVYKSSASPEERKEAQDKLQNFKKNANLTEREKELFEAKSIGKTIKELAKQKKRSKTVIKYLINNAIAKVQDKNGLLPEKFKEFSEKLISRYSLNISSEEIKNILLNNTIVMPYSAEKLFENIDTTSNLLQIESKDFIQAGLKHPPLFYMKPETIMENINTISNLFQIESKDYIQVALKQPQLFYQKPATIMRNINTTSNLLQIGSKDLIQAALKMRTLFCMKPETIVKKVRIIQYYKQIQHKKSDKIVFCQDSDSILYRNILNYLIRKSDGLKKAIPKKEFVEYLENKNKVYNLEIPENELAQEFIQFAEKFSKENFGKQIFFFKILKHL